MLAIVSAIKNEKNPKMFIIPGYGIFTLIWDFTGLQLAGVLASLTPNMANEKNPMMHFDVQALWEVTPGPQEGYHCVGVLLTPLCIFTVFRVSQKILALLVIFCRVVQNMTRK